MNPFLLYAVAKLRTGAVVYSPQRIILLLACEAYCRSKSVDVHAEVGKKSLPPNNESLFIGIYEEAEGRGLKTKPKIEGLRMNVISTMSTELGNVFGINIGPQTKATGLRQLSILYEESSIIRLKKAMKELSSYEVDLNINNIRQLVSGFGDGSTYKPYRASMDSLEMHENYIPATVFNLCDFTGNGGYGVSSSAALFIGSIFLNIISSSTL